jgi:CBS domain-containing protein
MSLECELQEAPLSRLDLTHFIAVQIGTSVKTTVEKMRAANRHCTLVMDKRKLVGIFTDRDILHKVVDNRDTWERPIDDVMTPAPLTATLNNRADMALALMNYRHFRNAPVLRDNGAPVGNLTHYAIIKFLAQCLFPDEFPDTGVAVPEVSVDTTENKSWFFGV